MIVGGGLAGLAGMAEVSAIQGRLRPSLSPGYGYTGFLISWMAGGHPVGIVVAAFVLAVITAGGDILQMTQALPGLGGEHPDGRAALRRARPPRRRGA